MLSALLVSAALAGSDPLPLACPLAWELHPVGFNYGVRFDELFVEQVSGPKSSPLFREPLSSLDVYYRLIDETGSAPDPTPEQETRWTNAMAAGASLAAEKLLLETLARSDSIETGWLVARSFFSPSLTLTRDQGAWTVGLNREDPLNRVRMEMREDAEGLAGTNQRKRKVAVGYGFQTRDPQTILAGESLVSPTAYLKLDNLVVDHLNLSGDPFKKTWSLAFRKRLVRQLSSGLSIASHTEDWIPQAWGASLVLPIRRAAPWTLILQYSEQLPFPKTIEPDWTVRAALQWLVRNPVVDDPAGWPSGQRVGGAPPVRPDARTGEPNLLVMGFFPPLPPEVARLPEPR